MIKLNKLMTSVASYVTKNKGEMMLGVGVAGLVYSVYTSAKAANKATIRIEERKLDKRVEKLDIVETVKVAGPVFLPTIITTSLSAGMVIYAYYDKSKKYAALAAAYGLLENSFNEYRETVIKRDGERKTSVHEDVVKDIVGKELDDKPPKEADIIETGRGTTLCYDMMSGRYFRSSADSIKRSEVQFSKDILRNDEMTLNEWYYEIGLPENGTGDDFVFDNSKDFDIKFVAQLKDGREPVLAVTFRYEPRYIRHGREAVYYK